MRFGLVVLLAVSGFACDDGDDGEGGGADMAMSAGGEGGGGGAGGGGDDGIPAEYRDLTNPLAGDADALAAGEAAYATTCGTCHGADGTGGPQFMPPATDFTGDQSDKTDGYYFYRIREGAEGGPDGSIMPAYDMFSDDEVWQLITYIRSFGS